MLHESVLLACSLGAAALLGVIVYVIIIVSLIRYLKFIEGFNPAVVMRKKFQLAAMFQHGHGASKPGPASPTAAGEDWRC